MGFTTTSIIGAVALAAGKAIEAHGARQQSKELSKAAAQQQAIADNQADAITNTALENHRRNQKNARARMAAAKADAASSNVLSTGTILQRELDMATRLEDEINNSTNAALAEANTTRTQGTLTSWNTRMQAKAAKNRSLAAGIGGVGSVLGVLTPTDADS